MTPQFNDWWNSDKLTDINPYRKDSPAYWAWEGWCAAVKAEREACAKVCAKYAEYSCNPSNFAEQCADAIRARGNT